MNTLLNDFRSLLPRDYDKYLTGDSNPFLRIESPNKELGFLSVNFSENVITLSTRDFHTHIDARTAREQNEESVSSCAIKIMNLIFNNKYYFYNVIASGSIKASGGGFNRLTQPEISMLVKMYGDKTEIQELSWTDEIKG